MNTILIIEDDIIVIKMLKPSLESEGFVVDVANDGHHGKQLALEKKYDIILLDIMLPLLNGYEVCREIRKDNIKTPIIMLTAVGAMDKKLTGFEVGADDYIIKPFEFKELLARIHVFLKRTNAEYDDDLFLRIADIEMEPLTKNLKRCGRSIALTKKEFDLLEFLIRNKGKIITKAELAEKVWQLSFETGTNVIEVTINYLRKKIDRDFPLKLIHTAFGLGYFIKEGENEN